MKILHITPSYKPAFIYGGPIISVSRLAESQQLEGAKVSVLTTTANGKEELNLKTKIKHQFDGVSVQYFPRWTKDHTHFSPGLLWELSKTAKHYDVIHIHSWWNLVVMGAVLVCWLRGIRPVLSPRGMLSTYTFGKEGSKAKQWLHWLIGKWLLGKTVLHGTVRAEVAEGKQIHPNWESFVAPNIVVLPKVEVGGERLNFDSAQFKKVPLRMVFLSRIDRKKGLDITLKALAKLSIPWHLSIAGEATDTYQAELNTLIESLGITEHISWLGWLNGDQKYHALGKADLFVLTSRNENFANVVLESLACGTPVLVSKYVGLSDYIAQNTASGQVCSLAPGEIASKIESIFQNQQQNGIPRKAIQEQVMSDFDSQKIAQEYLAAYQLHIIKTQYVK